MSKRILWLAVVIVVFSARGTILAQPLTYDFGPGFANYSPVTPTTLPDQSPWPTVSTSPKKVVLLSHGQVVHGEILSTGDPVQIRNELGVIPIPRSDVALVAATLQEVYQFQKANVPKTADGFLQLADWCVTNKLINEAAAEFDRAILMADDPQLADAIRNRKNAALSMLGERQLQTQTVEQENQKYRQWKQSIPISTFTSFKREILPMLVQNCNGIACHSGNSLSEFRFVANPHNNDLDVAKNLQVVLGYITPGRPEESPLVLIPIAPHGRTKQIFTRRNFPQYEKLYDWVDQVAGEMNAYYPLDATDRVVAVADHQRHQAAIPRESDNTMTLQQASGGNLPFPAPGETLIEKPITDNTSTANLPNQPSSLAQGLTRNVGASGFPSTRQAGFNFLEQKSIVPPGTTPGGLPRPASANSGLQQEPKTAALTLNSTDAFEQNNVMQQLQLDPLDPFDPVLFNRQYHLQRLKESYRQ